jgi:peptide alpha-N-acetyltransferase
MSASPSADALQYVQYHGSKEESYLPAIRQLISKDLSEPYSIYVYRYFLYQWGELCYMVCPAMPIPISIPVPVPLPFPLLFPPSPNALPTAPC